MRGDPEAGEPQQTLCEACKTVVQHDKSGILSWRKSPHPENYLGLIEVNASRPRRAYELRALKVQMSTEMPEVGVMKNFAIFFRRLDAFCAKLNDGLTAVAVVLAVLVAAEAIARIPETLDAAPQSVTTDNLSTVAFGGY